MGFFSEKRTFVSSSYLQLIEQTPDIITQSITASTLNNSDITGDIVDTLNNSMATKLKGIYGKALKNVSGVSVPKGIYKTKVNSTQSVISTINSIYPPNNGDKTYIVSQTYGMYQNSEIINECSQINKSFTYNANTYSFTINSTGKTYKIIGLSIINNNIVRIYGDGKNLSINFPYNLFKGDKYFNVKFYQASPVKDEIGNLIPPKVPSKLMSWTYHLQSNKFPQFSDNSSKYSDFFPVLPLRISNRSLKKTDKNYKGIEEVLSSLSIDVNNLLDSIEKSPDIAEIDHAYFVMGVDPYSNDIGVADYLYEFFLGASKHDICSQQQFMSWYNKDVKPFDSFPEINSFDISDGTYAATLSWYWTTNSLKKGRIGATGKVTKVINAPHPFKKEWTYWEGTRYEWENVCHQIYKPGYFTKVWVDAVYGWVTVCHKDPLSPSGEICKDVWQIITEGYWKDVYHPGEWVTECGWESVARWGWWKHHEIEIDNPYNTITLRKQLDEDTYREIVIHGLLYSNKIYGGSISHVSNLEASRQKEQQKVLIPLDVEIVNNLPFNTRNYLIYTSFHLVVNAIKVVKLKWYETSFFSAFVQVIGLAFSAISLGTSTIITGLVTAAAAGITALAQVVIKLVIQSILINATFKFAIDKLGLEKSFILALVVSFVGLLNRGFKLDIPIDFTFISSQFFNKINTVSTESLEDILEDQKNLDNKYNAQMEAINAANKDLGNSSLIDPLNCYDTIGMFPQETVNNYYTRMVGLPNSGTLAIQAVTNFVDNALSLENI